MTYEEKFLLLAKTDDLFRKDCQFLKERWKPQKLADKKLGPYLEDLRFLAKQSGLPPRFVNAIHDYLKSGKLPNRKNFQLKKVEAGLVVSSNSPDYGRIILKIDPDARLVDIKNEWKALKNFHALKSGFYGGGKTNQKLQRFPTIVKVLKNKKASVALARKDDSSAPLKGAKYVDLALPYRIMRSRNKKKLIKGRRIPVRNRTKYEVWKANQSDPF